MTNSISFKNPTINSGVSVKLLNSNINYSWKNIVSVDPSQTSFSAVEAQLSGWENPTMNLTFYIPIDNVPSSTMTWSLWNQFVKSQYLGTSDTQTTITINVGSSDTAFSSYASTSSHSAVTNIPVQIKSYSLAFGAKDSSRANFWTIQAQLVETI